MLDLLRTAIDQDSPLLDKLRVRLLRVPLQGNLCLVALQELASIADDEPVARPRRSRRRSRAKTASK